MQCHGWPLGVIGNLSSGSPLCLEVLNIVGVSCLTVAKLKCFWPLLQQHKHSFLLIAILIMINQRINSCSTKRSDRCAACRTTAGRHQHQLNFLLSLFFFLSAFSSDYIKSTAAAAGSLSSDLLAEIPLLCLGVCAEKENHPRMHPATFVLLSGGLSSTTRIFFKMFLFFARVSRYLLAVFFKSRRGICFARLPSDSTFAS